jgi:hypothetical protein
MTIKEFIEHMKQEVREEGYMTSMNLAARIELRAKEHDIDIEIPEDIMRNIPCHNIHTITYTNSVVVKNNDKKTLYYFNPFGYHKCIKKEHLGK